MAHPLRTERQQSPAALGLGAWQLAWLAAAVFVVSAGYGALMPLLPAWLAPLMAADGQAEVARYVGLLSGLYAAGRATLGTLIARPAWWSAEDALPRSPRSPSDPLSTRHPQQP